MEHVLRLLSKFVRHKKRVFVSIGLGPTVPPSATQLNNPNSTTVTGVHLSDRAGSAPLQPPGSPRDESDRLAHDISLPIAKGDEKNKQHFSDNLPCLGFEIVHLLRIDYETGCEHFAQRSKEGTYPFHPRSLPEFSCPF